MTFVRCPFFYVETKTVNCGIEKGSNIYQGII